MKLCSLSWQTFATNWNYVAFFVGLRGSECIFSKKCALSMSREKIVSGGISTVSILQKIKVLSGSLEKEPKK